MAKQDLRCDWATWSRKEMVRAVVD